MKSARDTGRGGGRTVSASALATASLLVLVVLAIAPGLEQPGRTAREAVLFVGVPLLLLLALAPGGPFRGGNRVLAVFGVLLGVPALAGLSGVAIVVPGPERWTALRDLLGLGCLAGAALGGFLLARRDVGGAASRLAPAAAVALLVAALAGLAQAWFGWEGLPVARPPAGPFVNRNVAAQALVPLLAMLVPAAAVLRSRGGRVLLVAAAGTGAAFLLATRSRGGWAGAGLALAIAAGLAWRERRRGSAFPGTGLLAAALLAGGLAGALVPVVRLEPLPSVGRTLELALAGEEGSLAVRAALRANTLAMIANAPLLGVGPGRFRVAYSDWQAARMGTPGFGPAKRPTHVHCDPLEWAAELGVPAALALLVLLAGGAVLAAGAGRSPGSGETDGPVRTAWRIGAAAAVGGVLVHGLASFPLHAPASGFLAFLLAGTGWGLAAPRAGADGGRAVGGARSVLVAFLAVLAGAGGFLAAGELRGQAALARALRAWSSGDCRGASAAAREVFRREPWNRRDLGLAGGVIFRCDRSPAALPLLERARELDPGSLVLALDVGARRLKAGDPEGALACYRRALRIRPELGRGWLGVAMASLDLGDERTARAACARALAAPDDGAGAAIRAFCRGNRLVE